jgi:hypothetical protein
MVRGNILVLLPLSLAKTHLIQDASHGSRNIQAITLLRLVIHTSVDKIGKSDKNVLQLSSLSTFLGAKTHLIQDERHGSFTIQAITMLTQAKHASVDKISRDQNLIRLHILVLYLSLWLKPNIIQDASHGSRNIQAITLLRLMILTSVAKIGKRDKNVFNSLVFQLF